MRAISGLWRWRSSPLSRPTDRAEAWVCLVALLLICGAAPAIGWLTGAAAQDSLRRSVAEQRHTRQRVPATVLRRMVYHPPETDPDAGSVHTVRSRVLAGWTAPDGTRRHGAILTGLKSPHRGDRFMIWTDRQGHMTSPPLDTTTAKAHAVLAGFGAALLAAALIETGRRLVVWRMVRRRYARWDQAWERAGPDWGKAGTGS
ncbi:hypothetical protein [Streptomyces sp. LaPpAH-108]|uniref:Rv1733c family protein n=1 Tax=Streptomyces sp. LaPpAH-108 TaxID=1155714 RepID=UPI000366D0C5|nr:hypothetical protein [Streptomyces sp. LaPpAH-108]